MIFCFTENLIAIGGPVPKEEAPHLQKQRNPKQFFVWTPLIRGHLGKTDFRYLVNKKSTSNSWTLYGWFKDLVQCLRLVAFAGLPDKNMACTRFVHTYMYILSCLELAHHVPPSSSSPTSHPQVQTALFIGLGALSGYIALKMVFYCWLRTVWRL